jgi:hypothetical protein
MYSSDYLRSDDAIETYRLIGHSAEIKFKYIERNIKEKKKNYRLIIDDIVFDVDNDLLHYNLTIEKKNCEFLNIDVKKKIDDDLMHIKLINGFVLKDLKTSKKVKKECSSVSYTYNKGIVDVEQIKTQDDDNPLSKRKKRT